MAGAGEARGRPGRGGGGGEGGGGKMPVREIVNDFLAWTEIVIGGLTGPEMR